MSTLPYALSLALFMVGTTVIPARVTAAAATTLDEADADFITKALLGGMTDLRCSDLVLQRGLVGPDRDFAERIFKDHQSLQDALTRLATTKGVPIPPVLDAKHQAYVDDLSRTPDVILAKAYLEGQEAGHLAAHQAYITARDEAKDRDVQAFAAQHAPMLHAHLSQVQELLRTP